MNLVETQLEPVKVVGLLKKELGWQLDYDRSGIFENKISGLFFFICIYHNPLENSKYRCWHTFDYNPIICKCCYTLCYYSRKEIQFICKCGVEFKNVYEIWSKEKKVDLATAVKEVNYLIKNFAFENENDYEQLPQYKPSFGGMYRVSKKLIKKNVYKT